MGEVLLLVSSPVCGVSARFRFHMCARLPYRWRLFGDSTMASSSELGDVRVMLRAVRSMESKCEKHQAQVEVRTEVM
jgi:hypothetical protein